MDPVQTISQEQTNDRFRTMIPSLDKILEGGFPAASINIITGGPGTGKTVLAQQILYNHTANEGRALYLTTLNEPLHKVLRYVQNFPFFDEEKVGSSVIYEDVGAGFEEGGIDEVMARIGELVMRESPTMLVVDSFKAISEITPDALEFRRALYRLTGLLTASGCTTFLLGEYDPKTAPTLPEFAVADGVLDLTDERRGIRTYRYLSVAKLRGSGYADGRHAFSITRDGIQIYPRFRTPSAPVEYEATRRRVTTGVPDLDRLTNGGLFEGSSTMVEGGVGLGKTLLGLSFTNAHTKNGGGPVVFASFCEDPTQLTHLAGNFGGDLNQASVEGNLDLVYVSPVELDLDQHILRIVDAVEETDAKYVVIDSLSDLEEAAFDQERFMDIVFSLIQYFKDRRITTIMIYNLVDHRTGPSTGSDPGRLFDNTILLSEFQDGSKVQRKLRIIKTRGTDHDHDWHQLRLTDDGIVID